MGNPAFVAMADKARLEQLEKESDVLLERIIAAGWYYDKKDLSRYREIEIKIASIRNEDLVFTNSQIFY